MQRFIVLRESDIGIAVVGVQARAKALGFNSSGIDKLATAVSELARNIIKYCPHSGGDILLHERRCEAGLELVVQARDNGPGIENLELALSDHFSSSGSLGLGLPGVRRIVDQFAISSVPGAGTVVTISLQCSP